VLQTVLRENKNTAANQDVASRMSLQSQAKAGIWSTYTTQALMQSQVVELDP